MKIAITTIYVLNCFFLMMVVLMQAGRGGGLTGGSTGGSGTVFGNRGATTFLQKLTVWSAATFMGLSMLLAHMSSQRAAIEEGTFENPEPVPTLSGVGEGGTTSTPGTPPTDPTSINVDSPTPVFGEGTPEAGEEPAAVEPAVVDEPAAAEPTVGDEVEGQE